jgi:hypothetical protein
VGTKDCDFVMVLGTWKVVPDDLMRTGGQIPDTRLMFSSPDSTRFAIWWNRHNMGHAMTNVIQATGVPYPGRKKHGVFFTSDLDGYIFSPMAITKSPFGIAVVSQEFLTKFIEAVHAASRGEMSIRAAEKFKKYWWEHA